jgi:hypothetical protein
MTLRDFIGVALAMRAVVTGLLLPTAIGRRFATTGG